MSRYFIRPRAAKAFWVADDTAFLPSLEVADHEATDTGLLDVRGDCIMRAPREMGFGRDID